MNSEKKNYQVYAFQPPGLQTRGGHLGIFQVGMCRPGLQNGTPF